MKLFTGGRNVIYSATLKGRASYRSIGLTRYKTRLHLLQRSYPSISRRWSISGKVGSIGIVAYFRNQHTEWIRRSSKGAGSWVMMREAFLFCNISIDKVALFAQISDAAHHITTINRHADRSGCLDEERRRPFLWLQLKAMINILPFAN